MRSSGAALFVRARLPRCSKEEKVDLEEQTVNNNFYKAAQACWFLNKKGWKGKMQLKFVPSQTSGNLVELQRWMTCSSYYADFKNSVCFHMKSIQLAGRLYWLPRKIPGSNGWEKGGKLTSKKRDTLNRGEGPARETLEFGNETLKINKTEHLSMRS